MKASELFVRCLENEGVDYLFGLPGEENLDLLESLRTSKIKFVLTRHEQSAGFMAATYGRLTGKAGVCLSTLGPGATNLVTPAAYAQLGAMPMLIITGQKPVHTSKQGLFQIIDIVDVMQPLTKFSKQILRGDRIPAIIRNAFRRAETERPGAAHIEFPEDVAEERVNAQPIPIHSIWRPDAHQLAIDDAVERLEKAERPLILIGAGANRKRVSVMLNKFIDKTGIPFVNTQMGKGVVSEDHPLYLGTAALSDHDYLHCAIDRADLIINVGHDVVEKPPFYMEVDGFDVIHINFTPPQVDEIYFPQHEIVGDIANALEEMEQSISVQDQWDFSYFLRVKQVVDEKLSENADCEQFPLVPQRIISDVRKVMGDSDILALDNGMFKIWFARHYRAREPNTILLDNALATMGAGLPSAMAAKLVNPELKVMAICGDGGFMMNSQEIETAIRLCQDLVVLILNDNSYGMIKWKQHGMRFPEFGLDFQNPDFVRYAESYGAHGYRIEKTEDFLPLMEQCFNTPGVHVIEVPIDYAQNDTVLGEDLLQKSCLN
ncbi:MAG: acetolactate synthase large subunit [Gammaproteobacteria bacterium]|nr:acetolactate synthase large subunit [Gammaproteobacteria bacterium]